MKCKLVRLIPLSAAVLVATAIAAEAQTIPLLTFEVNEGTPSSNPHAGANSNIGLDGVVGGVGITEGANAFVIKNIPSNNSSDELGYQVSSSSTGEALNNYNAFVQAYNAIAGGNDVFLTYDYGYDTTNVTNTAFYQPGIALNSDQGFSERRFGNLLQGNIGVGGNFPQLNATAAAGGATMTILDPSTFGTDNRGVIRMRIPVGTAGNSKLLNIGPGGDSVNDFFQIFFHSQGGWQGTMDLAIDRVGFDVVPIPEPATIAMIGTSLLALAFTRRRRT
jgi:hypothetical protein